MTTVSITGTSYASPNLTVYLSFGTGLTYYAYSFTLRDTTAGTSTTYSHDAYSSPATLNVGNLDPTHHYTVNAYYAADEVPSPGSTNTLAVVAATTAITGVAFPDAVTLTVSCQAVSGYDGYQIWLRKPSGVDESFWSATPQANFTGPFAAGTYGTFASVTATGSAAKGPQSASYSVTLCEIESVTYSSAEAKVVVTYSLPDDYDGEYQLTLDWNGEESNLYGAVSPGSGTLTYQFTHLAGAGAGEQNTVSLALLGETGAPGAATVVAVVTATTSVTLVDCSDAATGITIGWAAAGDGYEAYLQTPGGTILTAAATGTSATFAGPLATGDYSASVSVTGDGGISIGPQSTACAFPLTDPPAMTLVQYDVANLDAAWTAPSGYTGSYDVTLSVSGAEPAVTGTTGTSITLTIATPLSGSDNGIAVAVAQDIPGVTYIGASSPAYTLLTVAPAWVSLVYDAAVLTPSWTGDPLAAGYLVTVSGATGSPFATGAVTTTDIAVALTPGGSYPTSIRATSGIVQGPSSPELLPLTSAPGSVWLGYDEAAFVLSWTATADTGVTGYVAQLTAGATVETIDAAASPQAFTAAMTAETAYSAIVRESGAQTLGPWSAVAVGPYQTSVAWTMDTQGRLAAEAWTAAETIAYAMDAAGNIGGVTPTATPTPAPTPAPAPAEA